MDPGGARNGITQLRRGVVEHCVLALLRDRPRYGFDLVRELSEAGGLLTSEGTIYPLLARLRRDGLVVTSWQESGSGPPRRYYALTDDGRASVSGFQVEWIRFRDGVDRVLGTPPVAGHDPDRGRAGQEQEQVAESRGSA
jgi:PadR family transcriptional regulator PadR